MNLTSKQYGSMIMERSQTKIINNKMRIKYMVSVKFGVETKDIKKVRKEIINVLMFHLPVAYQDFIVLNEVENRNTGEIEMAEPR